MEERPWFKYWPDDVPKTIDYPVQELHRFLQDAAKKHPSNIAILFYGKKTTYAELLQQAKSFAAGLQSLGVKKGDRVSLYLPNVPQFVVSFFGSLTAGAVVVQTNPLYTARELEKQLNDSGSRTIVAVDFLYPRIAKVRSRTPLKNIVIADIKNALPFPLSALYPIKKKKDGRAVKIPKEPWVHFFEDLIKTDAKRARPVAIDPKEDIAVLQYTGGTTGTPKGAMLTHHNLVANTLQADGILPDRQEGKEVFLTAIPLFHVYGLTTAMLCAVSLASTMVLHPDPREISAIVKLINKHKPTIFPGVPALYIAVNNHPLVKKLDVTSIRACISGSAPLPLDVRRQFERLTGGKLVEGYGLTEASPVTHCNPLYGHVKECIGIPVPDTDSKIVDLKDGRSELGVDETGELVIKGPQVMKGYWRNPEETDATLKDGWLHTGDIAYMDEDGYFHIVDRKKDMILVSGYNVYPREVEDVLYEHPAVKEAAVVGVPHPKSGEVVKAFISLKEGKKASQEEIQKHCRENLAPFKIPRVVEFREELPKSAVGKILRRELKEKTGNA
ncbi:MAG: long-chain fatty acid--CoA ligase [Thermoplasmata archaeon]